MNLQERTRQIANGAGHWLQRQTYPIVVTTLLFALLVPRSAQCQIFSPCCAEMALGLAQINSSLVQAVAGGLNNIYGVEDNIRQFEQNILYPAQLIAQTRTALGQIWGQVHSVQGVLTQPLQTATLPHSQQLETALLSRDTTQINQVGTRYQQLYGPVPADHTADPRDLDTIDASDALSQDAMKRAVVYDQIADQELQVADQMQAAINQAAPGTAPMIEASAAAWLVRSQAYTQSALADLMRVGGITLANTGGGMKARAAAVNRVFQQTGNVNSRQ